ncbi:SpoIIIAH-like family protein [Halalkalibacter akibai]|uniref:Stage III sporulation protein AH n=1 Tax=Halalkalibacter akibai (strain ATCC 43226 / DSM 21942 / CIP 109018 / JCM 9157 / 1139) TaxID=1236973 RepID=W4QXH0_HALA3|nr:SpoIIIAH-like family protein [Halalkalibacter akibai]GAE36338.1 stage III sporulation protein AH [Halalkalibacter akibai JCM 9157]
MVLKKQTVWLLTMLSLIIVLSVYYVTSPTVPGGDEIAFVDEGEEQQESDINIEELLEGDANEVVVNISEEFDEADETDGMISAISTNEAFTTIRMELQASRDRMAEEFTNIRASADASAEEKVEAHERSMELQRLAQKESQLETLIVAKGFSDALVLAEDNKVRVIVQTDELTAAQATEILNLTHTHLGANSEVTVAHQATK